ncbi:MAG TPA: AraC family transcriptional regulator N-terminal domain-containing protein [Terriglobales bacterium]|nr:AraC family transcriptional regulator N-terminal domain-containing protein [Terriglobales bacterium]
MKQNKMPGGDRHSGVVGMRAELARKIAAHVRTPGEHATAIPGLTLYRLTAPIAGYAAECEAGRRWWLRDENALRSGGQRTLCHESTFIVTSVEVPLVSEIVAASEKVPLLALFLELDVRTTPAGERRDDLLQPCIGLLDLLPFFCHLICRTIVYRLLHYPHGDRLHAIARLDDPGRGTAKALAWVRANSTKPFRLDQLAAVAGIGIWDSTPSFPYGNFLRPMAISQTASIDRREREDARREWMPQGRLSTLDMRARVSSLANTNVSSVNRRCAMSNATTHQLGFTSSIVSRTPFLADALIA